MKIAGSLFLAATFAALASAKVVESVNDGVCDVLDAPGVTRALGGLCNSWCNAREVTTLSTPVTTAQLENLMQTMPNKRILEIYNRKRNPATDPPMPCLIVDDGPVCPCFTAEETALISTGAFQQPASCVPNVMKIGTYANGVGVRTAMVVGDFCYYSDSNDGETDRPGPGLNAEEVAACQALLTCSP